MHPGAGSPTIDPSSISDQDPPARWRIRTRWLVHLGLLATAAAALVTLQFLHVRVAIHSDVGLAFVALLLVHLSQRRRTISRWTKQFIRRQSSSKRLLRLFYSDSALAFITLNMLASGVVDWTRGQPTPLPFPKPFGRWHFLSGLVLVVYLMLHVWHRRKRFRRSAIQ